MFIFLHVMKPNIQSPTKTFYSRQIPQYISYTCVGNASEERYNRNLMLCVITASNCVLRF